MILASCRNGFIGTEDTVPLQLHDKDQPIELAAVAANLAGKTAVITVHGFNNQFSGAMAAYQAVEQRLSQASIPYDAFIGFFWPGSWCYAGFFDAERHAVKSGTQLAVLLKALGDAGATVDIETHSLGAKVALEAVCRHPGAAARNLILTAPAVNNDCLLPGHTYGTALSDLPVNIGVMFSNNDPVLKFAYTPAQLHLALGLVGPEPPMEPRLAKFDLSAVIQNHGAYKDALETYRAWREILAG
jgi:esterase/lipase superfamily enzyme